jgi:histidinol-phosphate aminotransferase
MNPFWSRITRELSPYVPGEQPRIVNLVKLNTKRKPIRPLAARTGSDAKRGY